MTTTESARAPNAKLALVVSYDGAGFAGSQIQPGARTVQGELERVVCALAGRSLKTVFAGRTDRGVHAAGQVVGLSDPRPDLDLRSLQRAINAGLPPDVAIVGAERRPPSFHARYDARWREYRYRVWSGSYQPLARAFSWQRRGELDVATMDLAARQLHGERDLAAFAGAGEGVPWSERRRRPRGTVRRVHRCSCRPLSPWWGDPDGTLVEIRVVADGFLPRMVRNIAAALVEVGAGGRPVSGIDELLTGRDRRLASGTAPPEGLILWRVGYGDEEPDPDPEPGLKAGSFRTRDD